MILKNNHFISIAFLIFVFFYFSPNIQAQRLPEGGLRFHKDYTENGLVFGTITFPQEKMRFDSYYIRLDYISTEKKLRNRNSSSIRIVPSFIIAKHYGELQGGRTYMFAFEKPPGDYMISWVKLSTLKAFQYVSNDTSVYGFFIPFTVNKGEITYIGEININEYALKNETIISLYDNYERDKNAMKERFKLVNWETAVKSKLEINHSESGEKVTE